MFNELLPLNSFSGGVSFQFKSIIAIVDYDDNDQVLLSSTRMQSKVETLTLSKVSNGCHLCNVMHRVILSIRVCTAYYYALHKFGRRTNSAGQQIISNNNFA